MKILKKLCLFCLPSLLFYPGVKSKAEIKFKSQNAVRAMLVTGSDKTQNKIRIEVDKGFHINEKAPNRALVLPEKKLIQLRNLSSQFFETSIPKELTPQQTLQASVYICDDALTVCEERRWYWNHRGQETKEPTTQDLMSSVGHVGNKGRQDNFGFLKDDLVLAQANCSKNRKPILAVFTAPWCPGCMRMNKEVWPKPEIKKAVKTVNAVKIDTDVFSNRSLIEKFRVAGIPTVLFLDCSGEEITRLTDFHEAKEIKSLIEKVSKSKNFTTNSELVKRAKQGDALAALQLARQESLAGNSEAALDWFKITSAFEDDPFYWAAKLRVLARQNNESKNEVSKVSYKNALVAAISRFPKHPSSLEWQLDLAELEGTESTAGKLVLEKLLQTTESILSSKQNISEFSKLEPSGDYLGIEFLRLFEARALAFEALKRQTDALAAWRAGVEMWDAKKLRDEPSGQYYRFLIFLRKSKNINRISKTFKSHLKKYPNDSEALRRYAGALLEAENFTDALKYSEKAMENAYDRNEIYAALVNAKALIGLDRKKEAQSVLLRYLARDDLTQSAKSDLQSQLSKIK